MSVSALGGGGRVVVQLNCTCRVLDDAVFDPDSLQKVTYGNEQRVKYDLYMKT